MRCEPHPPITRVAISFLSGLLILLAAVASIAPAKAGAVTRSSNASAQAAVRDAREHAQRRLSEPHAWSHAKPDTYLRESGRRQ
jgi:hypothetical protein